MRTVKMDLKLNYRLYDRFKIEVDEDGNKIYEMRNQEVACIYIRGKLRCFRNDLN